MLIEITFRKFVMQWGPLPRCMLLFYNARAYIGTFFRTFFYYFRRSAHLLPTYAPALFDTRA